MSTGFDPTTTDLIGVRDAIAGAFGIPEEAPWPGPAQDEAARASVLSVSKRLTAEAVGGGY